MRGLLFIFANKIKKPMTFKSKIQIKPYTEKVRENMGLEKYGQVLFEGAYQEEPLACVEKNKVVRYLTGLNEFAPELNSLPPDEKKNKIKQIRELVSALEKDFAANDVKPTDENFWSKITVVRPDNYEFWESIKLVLGNEGMYLDPNNSKDIIIMSAIEAGGFSNVAPSLEAARKMSNPPKFYLDRYEKTISLKTETKKLKNKALSLLHKVYDSNIEKLTLIAKILDIDSDQYKKTTPNDVIYDNMDKYINGEGVEKNKSIAATSFIDTYNLDMETLTLKALIKDAVYYKIISIRPDGFLYYLKTNTALGKNASDVLEYFKNPINQDILVDIQNQVEEFRQ